MTKRILLTREPARNESLSRVITNLGFEPVELPTIEIVKTSHIKALKLIREQVDMFDMFIFISVNAVNSGASVIADQKEKLKKDAKILAVGGATAVELQTYFPSVLVPNDGVGGQALMETDEMADLTDKHVMIVRGENGKEWLAKEIKKRGGHVDYFNCYRRRTPRFLATSLDKLFSESMFSKCFLHSAHAAINLIESPSQELREKIMASHAVVGSQDIEELLKELGWVGRISVAESPSNDHMLSAMSST